MVQSCSGVNLVQSLGVVNPVAEIFSIPAEKIPIFRKYLQFSTQKFDHLFSFFSRQLKKLSLFSQNVHIFTFYTYILT